MCHNEQGHTDGMGEHHIRDSRKVDWSKIKPGDDLVFHEGHLEGMGDVAGIPVVSLGQGLTRELGPDGRWRDREPDRVTLSQAIDEWGAALKSLERLRDLINGEDFRQRADGTMMVLGVPVEVRHVLAIAAEALAPTLHASATRLRVNLKEIEARAKGVRS